METAALPHQKLRPDTVDVRTVAESIQEVSKYAIARLDAMIAHQGEHTDIAKEMRDVYADFKTLADDISATSEFVGAALKTR